MLRVACPQCAKALSLPETAAGKSVKCPKCQAVFKAPMATAAAAGKAVAASVKKPVAVAAHDADDQDEAKPYGIMEDKPTPEQLRKSAQGEAVDQMVVDAKRAKLRNKAWDFVGTPAKFIKRAALTACILWICTYLFVTMVVVLANHNMEAAEKTNGMINTGGVKSLPKYLFLQDIIPELTPQRYGPLGVWAVASGGLILALAIYGLQLAGAESMKKLENYRLSMFAMIIGTLSLNLFGIWGLLALLDKGVQYQFRVSQRRLEGKAGEELYVEDSDDEEEEDEEGDEDDDDDDK